MRLRDKLGQILGQIAVRVDQAHAGVLQDELIRQVLE
jgi:hypothetical protein